MSAKLLRNVHLGLPHPEPEGESYLVRGSYVYYHYGCDGVQDQGWGCGYRTLQTLCSHIRIAKETLGEESSMKVKVKPCKETPGEESSTKVKVKPCKETPGEESSTKMKPHNEMSGQESSTKVKPRKETSGQESCTKVKAHNETSGQSSTKVKPRKEVSRKESSSNSTHKGLAGKEAGGVVSAGSVPGEPTLCQIQEALVCMQDKPASIVGSRDWIGSFEVSLCLDFFHDVPGKILHLGSGSDIPSTMPDLVHHFKMRGTPVMMGGDSDAASKGILGVFIGVECSYLLILDPHFSGKATEERLVHEEWVSWKRADAFMTSSFYNLCLPQFTVEPPR